MVFALILVAVASRLLPHPPNFAPIAAIGLFAGATLDRRVAWLVPFAALLLSDLVLGFYHPMSMLWNYMGFGTSLLIGAWLKGRVAPGRVALAALVSALAFFALSNFGMWASGFYPRTLAGLGTCYAMALPFFRNTLTSQLVYTTALFGAWALARAWKSRRFSFGAFHPRGG